MFSWALIISMYKNIDKERIPFTEQVKQGGQGVQADLMDEAAYSEESGDSGQREDHLWLQPLQLTL